MVRAPRADEAGGIYHALNHGNAKNPIFFKDADYEALLKLCCSNSNPAVN